MDQSVSELDLRHYELIRESVKTTIREAAGEFDRENLRVLDIAPQKHMGAKEFFAKATVQTLDINPASGADFIADLCVENSTSIPSASFDLIVCTEVLEHTVEPFAAALEIHRILRPGGLAVLTTPFNFRIHGPLPDCWRFTEHGLRILFRKFSEAKIVEIPSSDGRFLMPLQYRVRARK